MKLSPVCLHLREIAWQSVVEGAGWFVIQSWVFEIEKLWRPGYTFVDELTIFCWLSKCTYSIAETQFGKAYKIQVPDAMLYEHWMDNLRRLREEMERY